MEELLLAVAVKLDRPGTSSASCLHVDCAASGNDTAYHGVVLSELAREKKALASQMAINQVSACALAMQPSAVTV